jgi:hypothetical protein
MMNTAFNDRVRAVCAVRIEKYTYHVILNLLLYYTDKLYSPNINLPSKPCHLEKISIVLNITLRLSNHNKLFSSNSQREKKNIYQHHKMKFAIVLTALPVALALPASPITPWNPFAYSINWGCWADYVSYPSFTIFS